MPDNWELTHGLNPNDSTMVTLLQLVEMQCWKNIKIDLVAPTNLPFTLIKYDIRINSHNQVVINWMNTNEVNTKEFVIEKRFYGETFQAIGTEKAIGKEENNAKCF